MQEFHPVTHQSQQATIDHSQKVIWQAGFLGWMVVFASLFFGSTDQSRTALFGAGWWAVQFVSAPAVRTLKQTRRLKNDVDSVFLSALQKVLYDRLTEKQAEFEVLPQAQSQQLIMGDPVAATIQQTLQDYGVNVRFQGTQPGPTFTRFLVKPEKGVKVSQIENLAKELQVELGTAAPPLIGIQPAGISIDVPNGDRRILKFSDYISIENRGIGDALTLAVGVNLSGQLVEIDLSDPNSCHILGGGTTGSGKTEWERSALLSLVSRYHWSAVKLAIVDVKRVSFPEFEGSPWMLGSIAKDAPTAERLLHGLVREMDDRYRAFEAAKVSDINGFNQRSPSPLPRIVLLTDEYADLMDQADKDQQNSIDNAYRRLSQKARAAGIHLLVFTQKPAARTDKTPNGVDSSLRSNLPASVGLKVQRIEEAQVVMGIPGTGAEQLLGKGDLLLRTGGEVVRLQALLIESPDLITRTIAQKTGNPTANTDRTVAAPFSQPHPASPSWERDLRDSEPDANPAADTEFEQIDTLSTEELAHAIVDLALDAGVRSPTAFVEAFWGYGRGGSKCFSRAFDRAVAVYKSKGLNVWR